MQEYGVANNFFVIFITQQNFDGDFYLFIDIKRTEVNDLRTLSVKCPNETEHKLGG